MLERCGVYLGRECGVWNSEFGMGEDGVSKIEDREWRAREGCFQLGVNVGMCEDWSFREDGVEGGEEPLVADVQS
jgi:hypothetical protein